MKIQWSFTERWGYSGIDEDGNIYNQGHLRETTSVYMPDGRSAGYWTPEQALKSAKEDSVPESNLEYLYWKQQFFGGES